MFFPLFLKKKIKLNKIIMKDIENYRIAVGQKVPVQIKENLKVVLHFASKNQEIANFIVESGDYKYYFSLQTECNNGPIKSAAIVLNTIFYLKELSDDSAIIEVHCSCSRSKFIECISSTTISPGSMIF